MAQHHSRVPKTTEVIPGAQVNIVLKADQKTGRQVQGTIRDVLTRGDHHRGIKVRLTDGRIGRVQSMAQLSSSTSPSDTSSAPSDVSGSSTSSAAVGLAGTVDDAQTQFMTRTEGFGRGGGGGGGRRPRFRDMRLDDQLEAPPDQIDLSAYVVPAKPNKRKGGRGKKAQSASAEATAADDDGQHPSSATGADIATDVRSATATCPICNAFEGDEAAVAHHVAGHFE